MLRYKLKMSEYRGEQAEMNIQRLNVRIDQVEMVMLRKSGNNFDHTDFGHNNLFDLAMWFMWHVVHDVMRQSKDSKLIKSCFAPVADNCDFGDVNDAVMKSSIVSIRSRRTC